MNTVETIRPPTHHDFYDPDDVGPRGSPQIKAMTVNLVPSPSPPPTVPLPPISADSSPEPDDGRKGPTRSKPRPSQSDAVLVAFMANGKHIDVAREAGEIPLASEIEGEDAPMKGATNVVVTTVEDKEEKEDKMVVEEPAAQDNTVPLDFVAIQAMQAMQSLAAHALRQTQHNPEEAQKDGPPPSPKPKVEPSSESEPMEGVKATPIPSIKTLYVEGPPPAPYHSPERRHDTALSPSSVEGELPPIRLQSPQSTLMNGTGPSQITLPSIADQFGKLGPLPEAPASGESTFPQSPPGRPPPRFSAVPSHGSPPKSPIDVYRNQLPSPGRNFFTHPNNRRPSQSNGETAAYTSPNEYSGSSTETPSSDQSGSTPGLSAMNRMSIEGITNPQIGGFQCNYQGCAAAPFQTQYLLNSHRNVHSQNRPHYCSVKGCSRSEGGKGFKRKNEMIRHGLVHDSPGYVCPFCPDREHKYPRPDNLQRHVRVHHVDKDKDDAQLRDVLSQRPEGPSRGRRRRTGTS